MSSEKTVAGLEGQMPYLIDTDIIIYSLKNHEIVQSNFLVHEHQPKAVSVLTFGEMLLGAHRSQHVEKNLAVVYRVKELFPVVEIDSAIVETFANIKAKLLDKGAGIDDVDLLIASTALTLNYTLVISNEKHFRQIDGLIVNNWSKG